VGKRWLIFAGLACLIAATPVLYWPVGPRWRSAPGAAEQIIGFRNDDRFLYTAIWPDNTEERGIRWHLRRWDPVTGNVLGEVKLALPEKISTASLSADGSLLWLSLEEGNIFLKPKMLFFDARTGKMRGETRVALRLDSQPTFSPDGRYFWAGEEDGVSVISTADAKTLMNVHPPRSTARPFDAIFAPDSSALAILWRKHYKGSTFDCVQIVDVPDGKERCRFSVPPELEGRAAFIKWVGNRLYLAGNLRNPPRGKTWHRRYVFDLTGNSIDKGTSGPLLSTDYDNERRNGPFWRDGPDWVAYFDRVLIEGNTLWDKWRGRLMSHLGIKEDRQCATVSFFDQDTGRVRRVMLFPSELDHDIARDGKSVACLTTNQCVEVWDTDPPSRWPWAAIVGIASAGLVLFVGRWHSRRRQTVFAE
jgi:hypothetical protein